MRPGNIWNCIFTRFYRGFLSFGNGLSFVKKMECKGFFYQCYVLRHGPQMGTRVDNNLHNLGSMYVYERPAPFAHYLKQNHHPDLSAEYPRHLSSPAINYLPNCYITPHDIVLERQKF